MQEILSDEFAVLNWRLCALAKIWDILGWRRCEQQHKKELNPLFILDSRQQYGFYGFLAVTLAVTFVTNNLAIWALSISRMFLSFNLSHDVLCYYDFDFMQSLNSANVDLGNLWFSHQYLILILIKSNLLLLSFSSEFLCHIQNNWNHKSKFCKACQKYFLKTEKMWSLHFRYAHQEASYSSLSA